MQQPDESGDEIRTVSIEGLNNNNNNSSDSYDAPLAWFSASLINPDDIQLSKLQKFGKYFGLACGAASGAIAGPLAYSFSHFLTHNLHIDDKTTEIILSIFAGSTAAIAIMSLSARLASKVAINLLAETPQIKKELRRTNYEWEDFVRYGYLSLIATMGSLSGSPTIYITNKFFSKYIGAAAVAIDIPTALSLAPVRSWALEKVASSILRPILTPIHNRILGREKALTKQMRSFILKQLAIATQKINGMNPAQINLFFNTIYDNNRKIKNIRFFFDPTQFDSYAINQPAVTGSKVKTAVGFLGTLIGFLTPFSSYPLGRAAANSLCDFIGIDNADFREHFARAVGACSYLGLSCLAAFATKSKFEEFYSWCLRIPQNITRLFSSEGRNSIAVKLMIFNMFILFISLCSATPRAELNRETVDTHQFYAPIVIIAALISGFATDYWAIDEFINEYFQKKTNKQNLLGLVNQMMTDISLMNARSIQNIMDVIAPNFVGDAGNKSVKPIYNRSYKGVLFTHKSDIGQSDELATRHLLDPKNINDQEDGEPKSEDKKWSCGIM